MLNLDETIKFWDDINQGTEEHIYNVIEVLKDYVESKEYIRIDYSDLAVLILKIIENRELHPPKGRVLPDSMTSLA